MKKSDIWIALVVVIVGGAALFYYQQPKDALQPLDIPPRTEVPAAVEESETPVIRHPIPQPPEPEPETAPEPPLKPEPVPQAEEAEPLPPLDESDALLKESLDGLSTDQPVAALFNLKSIIRRLVVTVDNLPRSKLPRKYLSTRPATGHFLVTGDDRQRYLSEENFVRYSPFVAWAEAVDSDSLVSIYIRFYPLFQQAYEEIGYPSAYFNDRLVEVIDHLLETPVVQGPIALVRPHVLYRFADPELEALSAGQKMLIRIGQDNAARIKIKLQELRRILASDSLPADRE